jgi:dethiobiotin synthase
VPRGLFVTGTDTGVGKTVVSAALVHRYRVSVAVRYWKPIQTGIEQDNDTAEVERLAGCRANELFQTGIRLPRPLSPHLAARLTGTTIELGPLVDSMRSDDPSTRWIVEGAGGALVPINDSDTMADLMRLLALPIVVVARSALGTINHTLLTLEALRSRSLRVAGVVLVGDPNAHNRAAIERYGRVTVVGEMPCFRPLTPDALSSWAAAGLDPRHHLGELLQ